MCIWPHQVVVSLFLVIYVLYWDKKPHAFFSRLQDVWKSCSAHAGWWLYTLLCTWHLCEGPGQAKIDLCFFWWKQLIWLSHHEVVMIIVIIIHRALFLVNAPPVKFPFILPLLHTNCSYQVLCNLLNFYSNG